MKTLLIKKRSRILQKWFDHIRKTYPAETQRFWESKKNCFANPVGSTFLQGIEGLYDGLLQGVDSSKVRPFLDNIIRIRAVQDFSPSQALSFIFELKEIIRQEFAKEIREKQLIPELLDCESRIDQFVLLALDVYMSCREKIYELKVKELRNRSVKAF